MTNQIIDSLPAGERARIALEVVLVDLTPDVVLFEPGQRVDEIYFPQSGMISLVTSLGNRADIETGTVGYEGMAGVHVFLGVPLAATRSLVQVRGEARRLSAVAFLRLAHELPQFEASLNRYAAMTLAVANQLAACNLVHPLKQRCARWLLTVHDHVQGDVFALTHEYLAQMLGVRRAGVTRALGDLTQAAVITSRRGTITILNRGALESAACECRAIISRYLSLGA